MKSFSEANIIYPFFSCVSCISFQVMKEVQSALNTAAVDDSKLVLLSAVGSVFCCGLDFIYFIRRLTDDRKRESTKMADAIRFVKLFKLCLTDHELKQLFVKPKLLFQLYLDFFFLISKWI